MKTKNLDRITIDPNVMHGKPSIRNMRFTVSQMLELLAGGMSFQEILDDYPFIEMEDIQACLNFAAKIASTKQILPIA
ncbi:MAG: DUF433 domain-containing protein [Saprospirales bacterium]|jgi:uncharacterized protein (DUF433 family)|nr:DUF433 domain-containing protein [Saprospirales bacterium]